MFRVQKFVYQSSRRDAVLKYLFQSSLILDLYLLFLYLILLIIPDYLDVFGIHVDKCFEPPKLNSNDDASFL